MKRETMPAKVVDKIMGLCSGTVPGVAPVYVPAEAAGWSLMNECFPNVRRMVRKRAGSRSMDGRLAVGEYCGNA